MPPKRRSTGGRTASARQQATLSFNGKQQSRVTKPTSAAHAKSSKKDPALVEDVARTDLEPVVDEETVKPTTAQRAIDKQTADEASTLTTAQDTFKSNGKPTKTEDVLGGRAQQSDVGALGGGGSGWVGDEEIQARKISDTQIKKYWREKEQERLAPRVHQQDLTVYEKVLREWDMSGQYGPCIGIARLKRWKRANLLGLNPPKEVLTVLLREMDSGDTKAQRAHVDELMNSRAIET